MKFGVWIHEHDLPLGNQIIASRKSGLQTIRSYSLDYAIKAAPILKQNNMSLLAGMYIDSEALATDWRSQIRLDELEELNALGVKLKSICVGNELRQGGDSPETKQFTARLSFGLANLVDTYRVWMEERGIYIPLTYAMEGIVLDRYGCFYEWVWPLIDALDIISLNLYPMGVPDWHDWSAFERSRQFLTDPRVRNDRLALYEARLRQVLSQLESAGKLMFLTETGFPSAVNYHMEGANLVIPETDNDLYFAAMREFISRIQLVNTDYKNRIKALYFYEWRDNLYHSKIWNIEKSPIHVAFGLCDRLGNPKFDIFKLISSVNSC